MNSKISVGLLTLLLAVLVSSDSIKQNVGNKGNKTLAQNKSLNNEPDSETIWKGFKVERAKKYS